MVSSALNGNIMVQKGVFWTMGNTHTLLQYPLIFYQGINKIDGWNNGYVNHGDKTPLIVSVE